MDETKDVLVKYDAPWEGDFIDFGQTWEELAEELKGIDDLIIA